MPEASHCMFWLYILFHKVLPVFWCACSPLNVHLTQAQSENQIRLFSAKISLKVIIYIMQEACGCIVCRRNSLKALRRLFIITVLHCWFVFYTLSHQSDFPGCLVHQLGLNKESSWVSLLDIWHLISLRGGLELKKKQLFCPAQIKCIKRTERAALENTSVASVSEFSLSIPDIHPNSF